MFIGCKAAHGMGVGCVWVTVSNIFRSHKSQRYFKETLITMQIFNSFKNAGHAENGVVVPTVLLM